MLSSSRERIESSLGDDQLVLDVGAWAAPWSRADWVIDLMPYETRGLYGAPEPTAERFTSETWVRRDICDSTPWPFADDQFDFAVCSHTLEDVRDPVGVCAELNRVAKAGYLEVPSRIEEQSWGVVGPHVGWSHHRWLVDVAAARVDFVAKPHALHGNPAFYLPAGVADTLSPEERVQTLFWSGGFEYAERIFLDAGELDEYLIEPLLGDRASLQARLPRPGLGSRLRSRVPRRR